VRKRPTESRWNAAWNLLAKAVDTGPADLVVVPAASLANLRQEEWAVPADIDRLANAVNLSRRAERTLARTIATTTSRSPVGASR
jgi:hypothetical protein